MPSFNKVILMGNLTRDPEMRSTPSGQSVCKFSLAVSRTYKSKEGEKREETSFIDIEAWGRQAEVIAQYCTKGKPLMIEGRLKLDQWEDKTSGQKRSKLGVVLETFTFVGARGDDSSGGGDSRQNYESTSPPARESAPTPAPAAAGPEDIDEDVPF